MRPGLENIITRLLIDGVFFAEGLEPGLCSDELVAQYPQIFIRPTAATTLRPMDTTESTPNTYSGYYGRRDFPPHTDLAHYRTPPRFFLLRCVKGDADVATSVIDGVNIIRSIDKMLASRALVKPRRPISNRLPLMRFFDPQRGSKGLIRWDERYIRPANAAGTAAIQQFSKALADSRHLSYVLNRPGDILILDNWRMLHGRSSVDDQSSQRVIERVYFGANN